MIIWVMAIMIMNDLKTDVDASEVLPDSVSIEDMEWIRKHGNIVRKVQFDNSMQIEFG